MRSRATYSKRALCQSNERLLTAAVELVAAKGYELATIRSLRAGQRDGSLDISGRPEDVAKAASRFTAHGVGCIFRWVVDPEHDVLGELGAWRRQIAATGTFA